MATWKFHNLGFADVLKSIFEMFSKCVQCMGCLTGILPLRLFPFLTDVLLPHLQTGPGQIAHAYHTVEDGAPSIPVPPRHCRPRGLEGKGRLPCSSSPGLVSRLRPAVRREGIWLRFSLMAPQAGRMDRTRATNILAAGQDVTHLLLSISFLSPREEPQKKAGSKSTYLSID